ICADNHIMIVDLDKSGTFRKPLNARVQARNLSRLIRSIRKQGRGHPRDRVSLMIERVMEGYTTERCQ
ncbi:MAG TPA: hypothetical protein PLV45_01540, partial [bacterium]|nr:hypothetical protein [bacterium]